MRKVIAAINMSLDGYCDHDKMVADEEIHDHYTNLLGTGDIILYGRKTYELMEFWPPFLKNPSGQRSLDVFAAAINRIPKLVFSNTLKKLSWNTANLAQKSLEEEVNALKKEIAYEKIIDVCCVLICGKFCIRSKLQLENCTRENYLFMGG